MLGICSVIVCSVSRLSFSLILLRRGGEGLLHPLCEVQKRNRAENRNIQKGH